VILKARESARIIIAIGAEEHWHLQLAQRWIAQYNFYIPTLGSDVRSHLSLSALFSAGPRLLWRFYFRDLMAGCKVKPSIASRKLIKPREY
jgi:hypothetical protein